MTLQFGPKRRESSLTPYKLQPTLTLHGNACYLFPAQRWLHYNPVACPKFCSPFPLYGGKGLGLGGCRSTLPSISLALYLWGWGEGIYADCLAPVCARLCIRRLAAS